MENSSTLDKVETVSIIPPTKYNPLALQTNEDRSLDVSDYYKLHFMRRGPEGISKKYWIKMIKRNGNGTYQTEEQNTIKAVSFVEVKSESEVGVLDETTLSLEEKIQRKFWHQLEDKNKEIADLKSELMDVQKELKLTLEEFGRYLFENDQMDMKKKREDLFEKTFQTNVVNVTSPTITTTKVAHELPESEEASTSTATKQPIAAEANIEVIVIQEIPRDDEVKGSVQESREASSNRERISLTTMPSTAIERSIYNHYKLLMLTISNMLLSNDERIFKIWVSDTFSLHPSSDINEVFLKLDRKGFISSSNLTQLRGFFSDKLLRFDVVHLIDCFICGDYTHLMRNISSGKNNKTSSSTPNRPQLATPVANPRQPPKYELCDGDPNYGFGNRKIENYPRVNPSNAGLVATDGAARHEYDTHGSRHVKVGSVPSKSDGDQHPPKRPSATEQREPQVDMGSNGNKLSKPQHQDSSKNPNPSPHDSNNDDFNDEDGNWLCNHYKRRCHVKFACCDKYWPCHRCHNNESNCGQTKLKSINTKFVKCTKCSTEQEFDERSEFCVNCHIKFAKYFCPTCKHLTGKDDNPYHCEQCGICRIHEHRSFHCDTCGVCLDVQLRDNHKCREGSAHDECCICLEDAFTGCQILPCSHKVHKECATQMIRRGITRCPICRESFAHKLEKRTVVKPPARKHHGKK